MNGCFRLRGEDVTVRVNGAVLGGVRGVQGKEECELFEVKEFLNDIPVYRSVSRRCSVVLRLASPAADYAAGDSLGTLTLQSRLGTEVFEDCLIGKAEQKLLPGEGVETVLTLTAKRRSFENE